MLGTSLTRLRKAAPGSLTAASIAREMTRRGMKRASVTVTAFERGQLKEPDSEFVALYASLIGQPSTVVWRELRRVQRQRARGTGPFALQKVA